MRLMLRSIGSLLMLFLFAGSLYAQPAIVLDGAGDGLWIGKQISYLEDPENSYSLEQLRQKPYDTLFKPCTMEAPNFGNRETVMWNRFRIANPSGKRWMLSVLNYNIDTLTLIAVYPDGSTKRRVMGSAFPLSTRPYRTGFYDFELPVHGMDTMTFYLKVQTYLFQYPMVVSSMEKYVSDLHVHNLIKGMYYGLVVLFLIYNLVLFYTLRDRNYLYYSLYILFTAMLMAEHAGMNALIWGDRFHFLWNRGPFILALGSLFFLIFSMSFLETAGRTPRSHQVIRYFFIPVVLCAMVLNLLNLNLYASVLNQVTGMAILIFMSATGAAIWRQGYRPAGFYLTACGCYFTGVVIFILKTFAVLPYNNFTTNSMELGSALEMILFSLSMADRVHQVKKEKERVQRELVASLQENETLILEQNKILETKVEERTEELKHTLDELEQSQLDLEQKNKLLSEEKQRSDSLLLHILPDAVAEELKVKGKTRATSYPDVTVLFTDFISFTERAQGMSPDRLVEEINECFSAFDEIMERHGLEKIKTIGDAYMAAAGLPKPDADHAVKMVGAALDIIRWMNAYNESKVAAGEPPLGIRLGMHSGPVVAGVVGTSKFQFDIWGDTVNTASRLERHSEPERINISGETFARLGGKIPCTYRGRFDVKGKGEIDMYFVDPIPAEKNLS